MLADEDKGTLSENGEVTPATLGIEDNVTRGAQLSSRVQYDLTHVVDMKHEADHRIQRFYQITRTFDAHWRPWSVMSHSSPHT